MRPTFLQRWRVFFLPLYFRKSASSSTAHNCRRSSGILVFLLKPLPPRKTRYFVNKIVLTYYEEKLFQWSRQTFEIRGWRLRIFKNFEITRTIYSNSESSEQCSLFGNRMLFQLVPGGFSDLID
jgi:hypothetical protein